MGISGLLPVLKPITRSIHVSSYKGKRVAVDGYSWLHKATYCCAIELAVGTYTDKHVHFFLARVEMLRHHGVEPVLVFDGAKLPSKADEEGTRERSRKENYDRGLAYWQAGNKTAAEQAFQKAVDVSPQHAKQVIEACKTRGVQFVVAPYEADAQMAYLALRGDVHAVITEDGDLLTYGCPRVLFKLDRSGNGEEVVLEDLKVNTGLTFVGWTHAMFQEMCVMSGCDFLQNIPGIGIKKSHALIKKWRSFTKACKNLRFSGQASVPPGYEAGVQRALWVFRHQRVYCQQTRTLVHLTPLPAGGLGAANVDVPSALPLRPVSGDAHVQGQGHDNAHAQGHVTMEEDLDFLGPELDAATAQGIAVGDLDPLTKQPFDLAGIYKGCAHPPRSVQQQLALNGQHAAGQQPSGWHHRGAGGAHGRAGPASAPSTSAAAAPAAPRGFTTLFELCHRSTPDAAAGVRGTTPVHSNAHSKGQPRASGAAHHARPSTAAQATAAKAATQLRISKRADVPFEDDFDADMTKATATVASGGKEQQQQQHQQQPWVPVKSRFGLTKPSGGAQAGRAGIKGPGSGETRTQRTTEQQRAALSGGKKAAPGKGSIPHLFAAAAERSRSVLAAPFVPPARASGSGRGIAARAARRASAPGLLTAPSLGSSPLPHNQHESGTPLNPLATQSAPASPSSQAAGRPARANAEAALAERMVVDMTSSPDAASPQRAAVVGRPPLRDIGNTFQLFVCGTKRAKSAEPMVAGEAQIQRTSVPPRSVSPHMDNPEPAATSPQQPMQDCAPPLAKAPGGASPQPMQPATSLGIATSSEGPFLLLPPSMQLTSASESSSLGMPEQPRPPQQPQQGPAAARPAAPRTTLAQLMFGEFALSPPERYQPRSPRQLAVSTSDGGRNVALGGSQSLELTARESDMQDAPLDGAEQQGPACEAQQPQGPGGAGSEDMDGDVCDGAGAAAEEQASGSDSGDFHSLRHVRHYTSLAVSVLDTIEQHATAGEGGDGADGAGQQAEVAGGEIQDDSQQGRGIHGVGASSAQRQGGMRPLSVFICKATGRVPGPAARPFVPPRKLSASGAGARPAGAAQGSLAGARVAGIRRASGSECSAQERKGAGNASHTSEKGQGQKGTISAFVVKRARLN